MALLAGEMNQATKGLAVWILLQPRLCDSADRQTNNLLDVRPASPQQSKTQASFEVILSPLSHEDFSPPGHPHWSPSNSPSAWEPLDALKVNLCSMEIPPAVCVWNHPAGVTSLALAVKTPFAKEISFKWTNRSRVEHFARSRGGKKWFEFVSSYDDGARVAVSYAAREIQSCVYSAVLCPLPVSFCSDDTTPRPPKKSLNKFGALGVFKLMWCVLRQ